MKSKLYNLCYRKLGNVVTVEYKSLSGMTCKVIGTIKLPFENFIQVSIKTYMPNNGSYILQIKEDRVISIDGENPN